MISLWRKWLLNQTYRSAMPIMTHPGITMTGKKVIDAVTRGEDHSNAIVRLTEMYPSAAATMIMDLTVEAEAFGCPVIFNDDEVPVISGNVVSDLQSVADLSIPSLKQPRIHEFLLAARSAAHKITDRPVLGGCIGPFSLAGRLFGMTEIMTAAFLEPETISELVRKCSQFLAEYIKALIDTGISGIIMAEPAAGLLDESTCNEFSSQYIKKLVKDFQDDRFLIILHNCGNTGHVTSSMVSTGAAGLHFGNKVNMKQVLDDVPCDRIVFGNIDPVGVLKMGTIDQIKREVTELLDQTRDFPNFVLSTGCDTPAGVPLKNIDAFFDALHIFNGKIRHKTIQNSISL